MPHWKFCLSTEVGGKDLEVRMEPRYLLEGAGTAPYEGTFGCVQSRWTGLGFVLACVLFHPPLTQIFSLPHFRQV